MKFEKGQSGNPAGRPKGAKNKPVTEASLKSQLKAFAETIRHDINDFASTGFNRASGPNQTGG